MDCITDLDDNQSQLLEALQLSLPVEAGSRKKRRDKKLSLNPIYRQVPRVVDLCCQHLERHGECRKSHALLERIPSVSLLRGGFLPVFLSFLRKCTSRNLVNSIILILATTSPLKASSSRLSSADSRNLPHRQLQEESTPGTMPPGLSNSHNRKCCRL